MFIYSALLPSSLSSYILFLHHVLSVLHIFITEASFGCRAHFLRLGTGSVGRTRGSSSEWSDHLADGVTANQLVELFGPHFCSAFTLPLTSWFDYSVLTGQLVKLLGFIVSYAGGSPAMLGTPRRLDSSCKRRPLSWGLLVFRILRTRVAS
jgi:hypothetical protein